MNQQSRRISSTVGEHDHSVPGLLGGDLIPHRCRVCRQSFTCRDCRDMHQRDCATERALDDPTEER